MDGDIRAVPDTIWWLLLIVMLINAVIYGRLELSRRQRIKISVRESLVLWYVHDLLLAISCLYAGGYYFNA